MRYPTLQLTNGDLTISNGNIAVVQPPFALAQDVASAIALFLGELWYDTGKGVPYFEDILGKMPPVSYLVTQVEKAALTVQGVVKVKCVINSLNNRKVIGEVRFIDEAGVVHGVNF